MVFVPTKPIMESQTQLQIFLYYNLLLQNGSWNNQSIYKLFQPSLQKSGDSTFQRDNIQWLEYNRMQYERHQNLSADQDYPSSRQNQHNQQRTGLFFCLSGNLLLSNGSCKKFFPLHTGKVNPEWFCSQF